MIREEASTKAAELRAYVAIHMPEHVAALERLERDLGVMPPDAAACAGCGHKHPRLPDGKMDEHTRELIPPSGFTALEGAVLIELKRGRCEGSGKPPLVVKEAERAAQRATRAKLTKEEIAELGTRSAV